MSAETIINKIGDRDGWNDDKKLELCLEYIENQDCNDAFTDFLDERTIEGEL